MISNSPVHLGNLGIKFEHGQDSVNEDGSVKRTETVKVVLGNLVLIAVEMTAVSAPVALIFHAIFG